MRKFLDGLYDFAAYLAAFLLFVVFLIMMVMSVGRQFTINITDGDEFASWFMVGAAFLGLAHTFKRGELIRMGLVVENVRGGVRRAFEIFALTLGILTTGYIAYQAVKMNWQSWVFEDPSKAVLPIPLWLPQLFLSFGTVLLFVAVVDEWIRVVLLKKWPSYAKEPPKTKEEILERAATGNL